MDIKDIIFAAADDNAVAFQELVSAHLQAKAYDAVEALRPEAAASLVGEAKKCDDEDELDDEEDEDEDEDGKKSKVDEEVDQLDELSKKTLGSYHQKATDSAMKLHDKISPYDDEWENLSDKERGDTYRKRHNRWTGLAKASSKMRKEDVEQVDEVAQPRTQADMLAHILHQIKTTGHPVATDAQFRASHGKDSSKRASQEPPEDRSNYDLAQGGTTTP